jgi:acetyl-CoA synthetase
MLAMQALSAARVASRACRGGALRATARALTARAPHRSAQGGGKFSPLLTRRDSYEKVYESFQPRFPDVFNIGSAITERHVARGFGNDTALIYEAPGQKEAARITYAALHELSNRLGNALRSVCGVQQRDRVAIYLPQCPETAITHAAVYKIGAIALPLFTLFGPEAVQYRLSNSGARCVVTDTTGLETLRKVRDRLPDLKSVVVVTREGESAASLGDDVRHFGSLVEGGSAELAAVQTRAEDPALIIYTSGTTGNPKGCVHAHRVLLGHLPGVELPHNFFPQPGDVMWTPADWAWIGGLLDILLPGLYHGVPVVAHRAKKFDPDEAFHLMAKHRVRNVFMPPTALKLIRRASTQRYALRSLGIGGETLGNELLEWGRQTFGVTINEFYGQTECNLVLANCADLFPVRPGSMGKPVPGTTVAVLDAQGAPLPPNAVGNICVRRPGQTMLLEYWGNAKATREKFVGDWLVTGDQGRVDKDGYFWFVGRDDDIITSAGYRIGPGEIEDCLLQHPKVALAAAVGKPDPIRTEIVKVFVVLRPEFEGLDEAARAAVARDIQDFVKTRLAAHEYPREVEFIRELPMTTTGKVIRKTLRQLEIDRAAGKKTHS